MLLNSNIDVSFSGDCHNNIENLIMENYGKMEIKYNALTGFY